MRVMFINNGGGGYAHYVETAPGTSIDSFLAEKVPGHKAGDLLIRVNRLPLEHGNLLNPYVVEKYRDLWRAAQMVDDY